MVEYTSIALKKIEGIEHSLLIDSIISYMLFSKVPDAWLGHPICSILQLQIEHDLDTGRPFSWHHASMPEHGVLRSSHKMC